MKLRIPGCPVLYGRGATAYELQVWRIVVRVTHLEGDYWKWKPWRRVSVKYYPED